MKSSKGLGKIESESGMSPQNPQNHIRVPHLGTETSEKKTALRLIPVTFGEPGYFSLEDITGAKREGSRR